MKSVVQIDDSGRIAIPKDVMDSFGLSGGDDLYINEHDGAIELKPVKRFARLERVNGILVAVSDSGPLPDRDYVEDSRNERMDRLMEGIPLKP